MSQVLRAEGPLRALGAMSGTSLDGVDAAVIDTDGQDILGFGRSGYRAYGEAEQALLRAGFGCWPGEEPEGAQAALHAAHAALLADFPEAEVVGFHGQTLAHDPHGRGTFQLGDGEVLAEMLARPVVWDFRSADVAAGGEGAPLAPFFHHACARWIGARQPVAFLNLGGVGNLTWVDPTIAAPEAEGALLSFDTGPANAPLNDLMQARRGQEVDRDGALAGQGKVDEAVVQTFLSHPYFDRPAPKSLDRNEFGDTTALVGHLDDADAAATLTALCAASVAAGLRRMPQRPARLLVTGGGRLNPVLMAMIGARCDCEAVAVEHVGLDGDMLEAQAFAYLAVRVLRGLPTSCAGTTGVAHPVSGGRISPADPLRRRA
ncbi:anhydro-N-acetylmuramic acid kinase [Pseudooceanicola sp. CBS1P-1]|nr:MULTISPECIES: anhydro-N-acetylmuramic acid kinase [Pseudooceanicola]MBT9383694.1 anhydro-N-acetylmuramic acid kinase [Pseudooceanicola endophyticus]